MSGDAQSGVWLCADAEGHGIYLVRDCGWRNNGWDQPDFSTVEAAVAEHVQQAHP